MVGDTLETAGGMILLVENQVCIANLYIKCYLHILADNSWNASVQMN